LNVKDFYIPFLPQAIGYLLAFFEKVCHTKPAGYSADNQSSA
jgi:hypothetical protein